MLRSLLQDDVGEGMLRLVRDLFPITRSITGDGLRETLRQIADYIPLALHEVPTGTPVLDWDVPREWNIRAGRIETLSGRVLIDFAENNLSVVGYSLPIDRIVSREELAQHVHTLPDQPHLIPYRTGYYAESWGFCIAHAVWATMNEEAYRAVIDSSLEPGSLTYGEAHFPGECEDEVLLSVHCCHPSLANDNLSGVAVAVALAQCISLSNRFLSYRFLFIPATIGSLAWLSRNEETLRRIRHGLVLTCVGDPGPFHYKKSRRETADVDRAVAQVLKERGVPHQLLPFSPYGYDERQFCSPGYDLPVGCFMRSPNGAFPEYHTSADNPDFLSASALAESYSVLANIMNVLDRNSLYERIDGRGEPQLGRRGLYRAISGQKEAGGATQMALLWVLNLADGHHSLLDIATRSGLPFSDIRAAADLALGAHLLQRLSSA